MSNPHIDDLRGQLGKIRGELLYMASRIQFSSQDMAMKMLSISDDIETELLGPDSRNIRASLDQFHKEMDQFHGEQGLTKK